jgi:hypothetical protein
VALGKETPHHVPRTVIVTMNEMETSNLMIFLEAGTEFFILIFNEPVKSTDVYYFPLRY